MEPLSLVTEGTPASRYLRDNGTSSVNHIGRNDSGDRWENFGNGGLYSLPILSQSGHHRVAAIAHINPCLTLLNPHLHFATPQYLTTYGVLVKFAGDYPNRTRHVSDSLMVI